MRISTSISALALVASLVFSVQPAAAATKFVGASRVFEGTHGSPAKSSLGYFASSDTIRLFSDAARQAIERNGGLHEYSDSVAVNSRNRNVVYFATNQKIGDMLYRMRISSYNFKTKRLTVLFTQDLTSTDGNFYLTGYEVVGMDGNKLVLFPNTDNSPGPCANLWEMSYGYLDVTKPSAGIKTYKVPQYLIQQGAKEASVCEKSMGQ